MDSSRLRSRSTLSYQGPLERSEAPRPQGGASRRGNFVHIVPLDPAYPALAGRGTFRSDNAPNYQRPQNLGRMEFHEAGLTRFIPLVMDIIAIKRWRFYEWNFRNRIE
jgi:hypothetical protein